MPILGFRIPNFRMAYGGLDIGCLIAAGHERHMKEDGDGWPTDKWTVAGGLLGSIERVRDRGKENPRRVSPGVMANSGRLVTGEG